MQELKLKVTTLIDDLTLSDSLYQERKEEYLHNAEQNNYLKILVQRTKSVMEESVEDFSLERRERLLRLVQDTVALNKSGLLIQLVEKYLVPLLPNQLSSFAQPLQNVYFCRMVQCVEQWSAAFPDKLGLVALSKNTPRYAIQVHVQQFVQLMRNLFLTYSKDPHDQNIITQIRVIYKLTKRFFTTELIDSITEIEEAEQELDYSLFIVSFNSFLEDNRQLLKDKQVQIFSQQLIRALQENSFFSQQILQYDYQSHSQQLEQDSHQEQKREEERQSQKEEQNREEERKREQEREQERSQHSQPSQKVLQTESYLPDKADSQQESNELNDQISQNQQKLQEFNFEEQRFDNMWDNNNASQQIENKNFDTMNFGNFNEFEQDKDQAEQFGQFQFSSQVQEDKQQETFKFGQSGQKDQEAFNFNQSEQKEQEEFNFNQFQEKEQEAFQFNQPEQKEFSNFNQPEEKEQEAFNFNQPEEKEQEAFEFNQPEEKQVPMIEDSQVDKSKRESQLHAEPAAQFGEFQFTSQVEQEGATWVQQDFQAEPVINNNSQQFGDFKFSSQVGQESPIDDFKFQSQIYTGEQNIKDSNQFANQFQEDEEPQVAVQQVEGVAIQEIKQESSQQSQPKEQGGWQVNTSSSQEMSQPQQQQVAESAGPPSGLDQINFAFDNLIDMGTQPEKEKEKESKLPGEQLSSLYQEPIQNQFSFQVPQTPSAVTHQIEQSTAVDQKQQELIRLLEEKVKNLQEDQESKQQRHLATEQKLEEIQQQMHALQQVSKVSTVRSYDTNNRSQQVLRLRQSYQHYDYQSQLYKHNTWYMKDLPQAKQNIMQSSQKYNKYQNQVLIQESRLFGEDIANRELHRKSLLRHKGLLYQKGGLRVTYQQVVTEESSSTELFLFAPFVDSLSLSHQDRPIPVPALERQETCFCQKVEVALEEDTLLSLAHGYHLTVSANGTTHRMLLPLSLLKVADCLFLDYESYKTLGLQQKVLVQQVKVSRDALQRLQKDFMELLVLKHKRLPQYLLQLQLGKETFLVKVKDTQDQTVAVKVKMGAQRGLGESLLESMLHYLL